jgi:hypothetical protein
VGYLIQVPIDDDPASGHLLVEAAGPPPDDLQFASGRGGQSVVTASQSLEKSLDDVTPALRKVVQRLRTITPGEFTVEFGLTVGAEAGVVLAKGSVEAHFTVTATWKPGDRSPDDVVRPQLPGSRSRP